MVLTTALTIVSVYMIVLYCLALLRQDNSIVDIAYGPAFVLITTILYFQQFWTPSLRSTLVASMITLWGMRLAYRIGRKNWRKPEDFRYAAWRKLWLKRGRAYFLLRSFLQIFVLQGSIILVVALPGILAHTMQTDTLHWYNLVGILLWVFGFIFEAVGDAQLDRFLKQKKSGKTTKTIMQTGLWQYTRHPNYFGEALQWWGLALVLAVGVPMWWLAFISPVLITYLLVYVSGIPLLEAKWQGNPEWEDYARKTPAFIPRF